MSLLHSDWPPSSFTRAFAAGAAVGAVAALVLRHILAEDGSEKKAEEGEVSMERTRLAKAAPRALQPELLEEQLSRNRLFFGDEGQKKLEASFIVVVGLGGVGSHAAHMLARAGVGRIRLIDFDNVTLSSLNRHSVATRDDVGRPKVAVCADRFKDIVPGCEVDARVEMFTAEAAESLLEGNPDYVLDAIDDINTKADLLLACHARNLRVMSALGAGAKADPTRILIGTITDPVKDPLAGKLRWTMRKRLFAEGDSAAKLAAFQRAVENIRVIYSSEEAQAELAELTDEQAENPAAFGALPNFRLRVLPVLGTMPALSGIGAAAYIMTQIAGKSFIPKAIEGASHKFAHRLQNRLVEREARVYGNSHTSADPWPIADQVEVIYVMDEVWGLKSAFTRSRENTRSLTLTRFDRSKPALPYNLVLLLESEAKWLEEETKATGTLPAALLDLCEPAHSAGKTKAHVPSLATLLDVQEQLDRLEAVWMASEAQQEAASAQRVERARRRQGARQAGQGRSTFSLWSLFSWGHAE